MCSIYKLSYYCYHKIHLIYLFVWNQNQNQCHYNYINVMTAIKFPYNIGILPGQSVLSH